MEIIMEVYANQQSPNRERLNKFRSINQHKYFFNFVTIANENVGPSRCGIYIIW